MRTRRSLQMFAPGSIGRRITSLGLVVALVLAPVGARADESVFDDAAGFIWQVGTTEVLAVATIAAVAWGDVCRGYGCGALLVLAFGAAVGVGALTGVVAWLTDATADVPFVAHHSLWGAATGALTIGGLSAALSESGQASWVPTVAAGAATALAGGLYSALRRDRLLRDGDTNGWTHLMTWGPPLATLLVAFIAAEADADAPVAILLAGLATAVVYGATIAAVEVSAP